MYTIYKVTQDKRRYLPLLLLGDEQEDMIARYLDRGTLLVLETDGAAQGVCVVTIEADGTAEVKNLAVAPACQGRGFGRALLARAADHVRGRCSVLYVGTGDAPLTVPFYEKCGFVRSHVIKNFFTDNYDHPIIEDGVPLRDMIYLKKVLK